MSLLLAALVGGLGVIFVAWGWAEGSARWRDRRYGRLESVDLRAAPGALLRSPAWRLAGRPDEVRRTDSGDRIPVELKSRPAPAAGPPRSHVAQVAAYALLLEETTGRAPAFGILRYGDGREFRIDYGPETRRWLLGIRQEMDRPYDGRATPSVGRCARCSWRNACDRRAT